jgi:hypothetical protein
MYDVGESVMELKLILGIIKRLKKNQNQTFILKKTLWIRL